MKNYFSAILLGSLFSCSLLPIGIVDEPDTLIDTSSEPDLIAVNYESYDRAHEHYLVHLTWTDYAGNEWSQRGRLAKFKKNFHESDKRRLMDLRSVPNNENDTRQMFYFLESHAPDLIERPLKVRVRYCPLNVASKKKNRPILKDRPNKIQIIDDSSDSDMDLESNKSQSTIKDLD